MGKYMNIDLKSNKKKFLNLFESLNIFNFMKAFLALPYSYIHAAKPFIFLFLVYSSTTHYYHQSTSIYNCSENLLFQNDTIYLFKRNHNITATFSNALNILNFNFSMPEKANISNTTDEKKRFCLNALLDHYLINGLEYSYGLNENTQNEKSHIFESINSIYDASLSNKTNISHIITVSPLILLFFNGTLCYLDNKQSVYFIILNEDQKSDFLINNLLIKKNIEGLENDHQKIKFEILSLDCFTHKIQRKFFYANLNCSLDLKLTKKFDVKKEGVIGIIHCQCFSSLIEMNETEKNERNLSILIISGVNETIKINNTLFF